MRDQDFEKTMDTWADHETESAPQIQPTADMYRLVRARRKGRPAFLVRSRWTAVGAAVASLAVVAILYAVLFRSPVFLDRPPAYVGLREGFSSERGIIVQEPGKAHGRGPTLFRQLAFRVQKPDSQLVESVDLRAPPEETITLTPADNYRLFLEPVEDRYVYVFQSISSNVLVKLFPHESYSSAQNPLRQGRTYRVPAEPNWFYLGGNEDDEITGEQRLYVIASAQPIPDLDDLYTRYGQANSEPDRQMILSSLLDQLETITQTLPEEAIGWVFVFNYRQR